MIQRNRLPAEYQEVEYLESGTNLNQRIKLPYKCNQDSCIDVDFMFTDLSSTTGYQFIFECRSELNTKKYNFLKNNDNKFRYDFDNSNAVSTSGTYVVNANLLYKLKTNKNVFRVYLNDSIVETKVLSYYNFASDNNINLFGNAVGTFHPSNHLRIYKCKIAENDELKIDAYPCYRKSDGVKGFYDLVSNTFCPNVGDSTEDFITGPDINNKAKVKHIYNKITLPKEYVEVEYLESTGTQWFDIDVFVDNSLRVELDILYRNINDMSPFGFLDEPPSYRFSLYTNSTNIFVGIGKSENQKDYPCTIKIDNRYNIKAFSGGVYINDKLYSAIGDVDLNINSNHKFRIFGRYSNSTYTKKFIGRIFFFKVFNQYDLIPCYRKSDNKPGMYDLISGEFFTNRGEGEFIVGPEVKEEAKKKVKFIIKDNRVIFADESLLPSEYRRVKYLESHRTEYIDTNYIPTGNTTTFCSYIPQKFEAGANTGIYGARISVENRNYSAVQGGNVGYIGLYNFAYLGYNNRANNLDFQLSINNTVFIYQTPMGGKYKQSFKEKYINYNKVDFNSGYNMYIFSVNQNGKSTFNSAIRMMILYCLENNNIKSYLIPVVRNSDNKPGMYDLVTNTFLTNEGTGEFTWEEL